MGATAVHEAGHAVVASVLGSVALAGVNIDDGDDEGAAVYFHTFKFTAATPWRHRVEAAAAAFAGAAAEHLLCFDPRVSAADRANADAAVVGLSMPDAARVLVEASRLADQLVTDHLVAVVEVADMLETQRELTGDAVGEVVNRCAFRSPQRERRGAEWATMQEWASVHRRRHGAALLANNTPKFKATTAASRW